MVRELRYSSSPLGLFKRMWSVVIAAMTALVSVQGESCVDLFRSDDVNGTCGACLPGYSSLASSPRCTFDPLNRWFEKTDDESNPFDGVNLEHNSEIAFADLDGDGDLDAIVCGGFFTGDIHYYRNNSTSPEEANFIEVSYDEASFPFHNVYGSGGCINIAFADLDGDDDLDAFVGHSNGAISYFRNEGDSKRPAFTEVNNESNPFHGMKSGYGDQDAFYSSRVVFADLDGDGDLDAFVRYFPSVWMESGRILYFRNIGGISNHLNFTQVGDKLNPFHNISLDENSMIEFADWDGDGDLDVFLPSRDDLTLKNVVMYLRNDGSSKVPSFVQITGHLNPFNDADVLPGSNLVLVDIGGNSDQDAFMGNSNGTIRYFRQSTRSSTFTYLHMGDESNPLREVYSHVLADSNYDYRTAFGITFADLDGDGDLDAVVGVHYGQIKYFRNNGSSTQPKFTLVPGESSPFPKDRYCCHLSVALADLDGDGDLDAMLGGQQDIGFKFFRNDGSWKEPNFKEVNDTFNPLLVKNGANPNVAFVDLDNDGDLDAFVGLLGPEPGILFFRNDGNSTHPNFTQVDDDSNPLGSSVVGINARNANVAFVDFDGDGDIDAFVGDKHGTAGIRYFRNVGNLNHPKFTRVQGESNPFHGILDNNGYVALADLDGDGDLDAFSAVSGGIKYFPNSGANCRSKCSGRGSCAQPNDNFSPNNVALLSMTATFQGLSRGSDAIGICACASPKFAGPSCEQCAPGFYSLTCDQSCPKFSSTHLGPGEKVFPGYPTIDDCICDDRRGFVPVYSKEGNEDFQCMCKPGQKLNNLTGACEPCLSGTFQEANGVETQCQSCRAVIKDGPITTNENGANTSAACKCMDGFELDNNTNACVCETNSYAFGDNRDKCSLCVGLRPFTLGPGALSESGCVAGTGFLIVHKDDPNEVLSCQKVGLAGKVLCKEKGTFLETVKLEPGHWRIGNMSMDIRKCPNPNYCKPPENQPAIINSLGATWNSKQYCSRYHQGIMCSSCEEGFALKVNGCEKCTNEEITRDKTLWTTTIIVGSLLVLLPAAYVASKGRDTHYSEDSACCEQVTRSCKLSFSQQEVFRRLGILVRIGLGFVQVYAQYVELMSLLNPDKGDVSLLSVFSDLDFSQAIDSMRLGCARAVDFYSRLFIYTVTPLLSLFGILLVLGAQNVLQSSGFVRSAAAGVFIGLQMLFIIYPGVSSTVLRTFAYDKMPHQEGDDAPYYALKYDHTIAWDSPESHFWRKYAGVMILVYPIGAVVTFAVGVWLHKRWQDPSDQSEVKRAVSDSTGFLAKPFRAHFPYFECYELIRKLLLTSVVMLVYQASPGGAKVTFIALLIVFLLVLAKLNPYTDAVEQRFAEASLSMLFLVAIISILPNLMSNVSVNLISTLTVAAVAVELVLFLIAGATIFISMNRSGDKTSASEPRGPEDAFFNDDDSSTSAVNSFQTIKARNDSNDGDEANTSEPRGPEEAFVDDDDSSMSAVNSFQTIKARNDSNDGQSSFHTNTGMTKKEPTQNPIQVSEV